MKHAVYFKRRIIFGISMQVVCTCKYKLLICQYSAEANLGIAKGFELVSGDGGNGRFF